jgi:hypothetical protein
MTFRCHVVRASWPERFDDFWEIWTWNGSGNQPPNAGVYPWRGMRNRTLYDQNRADEPMVNNKPGKKLRKCCSMNITFAEEAAKNIIKKRNMFSFAYKVIYASTTALKR